jgi:hypothetical protein
MEMRESGRDCDDRWPHPRTPVRCLQAPDSDGLRRCSTFGVGSP